MQFVACSASIFNQRFEKNSFDPAYVATIFSNSVKVK